MRTRIRARAGLWFGILVLSLLLLVGLGRMGVVQAKQPGYDCCEIYADNCQCMNGCLYGCDCTVPCTEYGSCMHPPGQSGEVCCFCYLPN